MVRHVGGRRGWMGGGPPTALLYILLLAVNSTDLHKETNAPLPLYPVVRLFTRCQENRETHTHTHTHRVEERDAFQQRAICPISRLFRCSVVVVGVRAKFSPVARGRGRAKLGERVCRWYRGQSARRISPARGLCET